MKKSFIQLLIISAICIVFISISLLLSLQRNKSSNSLQTLNSINNGEEISDAEGYIYIIEGIGAAGSDVINTFGIIVEGFFVIIIPSVIMLLVIICQIISVLMQIGEDKNWKYRTSRVLIIISTILLFLLCLVLLLYLFSNFKVHKLFIFMALLLSIVLFYIHIKVRSKTKKKLEEEE